MICIVFIYTEEQESENRLNDDREETHSSESIIDETKNALVKINERRDSRRENRQRRIYIC